MIPRHHNAGRALEREDGRCVDAEVFASRSPSDLGKRVLRQQCEKIAIHHWPVR